MRMFARRREPEALEHDADRAAARALAPTRTPWPPARRPAAVGPIAPPGALPVPAGQPLEEHVRHDMQRRFEHDFSQVRVHVDDEMSSVAGRVGSRAMALGTHIAFAPQQYHTRDTEGRALIAHELAHVVQAARGATPPRALSRKDPKGAPFYQEAQARFNAARGREAAALVRFIELCEAVDREQVGDIPKRLDALEKADVYAFPPDFPRSATATALLVRLTLLGQPAAASRFRAWYLALPDIGLGRRLQVRRYYDDEIWFWEATLGGLVDRVDRADAGRSLVVLDGMFTFFKQVVAERDRLDTTAVAKDAERLRGQGDLTDSRFGVESHPIVSIARYHARLDRLARGTFVAAQAPFQVALEHAADAIAAGKDHRLLGEVKKRVSSTLARMIPARTRTPVEINQTVYVSSGRRQVLRQVDAFLEDKAALARSVKLTSYDETTATTFPRPTQELDPQRIVAIRTSQVAAIERIYGLEKDRSTGQPTADARENQAALAAVGAHGLRLHDDADWRRFLLAKFERRFATTRRADESLDAIVDLLRIYLKAFTVHSPMNIDDFGDNLLTQTFPRALTGQLVHDCGVYALRIAYMLSLIREHPALKLRFRFIQLPVHIGLIVTGGNLPVYFTHNDTFVKYDQADLQTLRARWDMTDATGATRRTPAARTAATDQQFLAELAGMEFVTNTDLPYIVSEVPRLGGRSASADKTLLWRSYRVLMENELFGAPSNDPKDPAYQFHLRYLEVLDAIKQHYNSFVVPFWNDIAHPAWVAFRPRLTRAERAIATATTPGAKNKAEQAFDMEAEQYLRKKRPGVAWSVRDAFDKVQTAFHPITAKTSAVMNDLQARPQIVAPRVQRSSGDRLQETFGRFAHAFWARDTLEHFAQMRQRDLTEAAPFAERKDLLPFID